MSPASSFRPRIAVPAAALGLLLGLGCSGKKDSGATATISTATIKGDLTYTRLPLLADANGVPTGLDTTPANLLTLPARGMAVRAYEYDTTSTSSPHWVVRQTVFSDLNGHYTMTVPTGENYLVQVESYLDAFGSAINLIADPNGLASTLPQVQRARYMLREGIDGTAATAAAPTPTGSVSKDATYTVNFAVTQATKWMSGSTELASDGSVPAFTTAGFEGSPTGSRVWEILDSVYQFAVTYGNPTPGGALDLHYLLGRSEPEGTFIQYDLAHWQQPSGVDLAYDGLTGSDHYFASIQGGANDDAADPSVIYTLLGHAALYRQNNVQTYYNSPIQRLPVGAPVDGLSPDLAMQEGLPLIMAANLLKSPYLADTDDTGALVSTPIDIRDFSAVAPGDVGPYSPRTLASMIWSIDLKANGITVTSPDTSTTTDWATIDPTALARIFAISLPQAEITSGTSTYHVALFEPANIYTQLGLLQNAKTSTEPVNLAAIFTDATINTITTPFNIPWPQPSTTVFGQAWTTSTTNGPYSYTGTLSMAHDQVQVQVNGAYPNASYAEFAYLGVTQTTDQKYLMSLQTTSNPLPAGATIQVTLLSGSASQTYTFSGSSTTPIVFTLGGNGNTTVPTQYPILVRLLSPNTIQPDISFTLILTPAPVGAIVRGPVLSR